MREKSSITGKILLTITLLGVLFGMFYYINQQKKTETSVSFGTVSPQKIEQNTQQQPTTQNITGFNDGLGRAYSITKPALDELGEGISSIETYYYDINNDGAKDKITKIRQERISGHSFDEYKIEVNRKGQYEDITPSDLKTVEGADCDLQRIKFITQPDFKIIKISRPIGETFLTSTLAIKTTYELKDGKLIEASSEELKTVCDVSELF